MYSRARSWLFQKSLFFFQNWEAIVFIRSLRIAFLWLAVPSFDMRLLFFLMECVRGTHVHLAKVVPNLLLEQVVFGKLCSKLYFFLSKINLSLFIMNPPRLNRAVRFFCSFGFILRNIAWQMECDVPFKIRNVQNLPDEPERTCSSSFSSPFAVWSLVFSFSLIVVLSSMSAGR